MVTNFSRSELALLLGVPYETFKAWLRRDLLPTFIDSPERTACTAFDALVAVTADMFCTGSTGADRTGIAHALHHYLEIFYRLAMLLDQGESDVTIVQALTNDGQLKQDGGRLGETVSKVTRPSRSPVVRMTIVSLHLAAMTVRERARQHKIDIGRKFAMTEEEAAEIARLPFVRRHRAKA